MRYTIKNNVLAVEIDSHGAEVKSVIKNNREYMWDGNPEFWARTSPVLFPFVGSLKDGKYSVGGKEYHMGQHGFARDMEFKLTSQNDTSIVFSLSSDEETLKKYPFEFLFQITYTITDNALSVSWRVENPQSEPMSFSIGAHPAFLCPLGDGYKLKFDTTADIKYYLVDGALCDKSKIYSLPLENGYADITSEMFDFDALIIEDSQAQKISLCYPDGTSYVTVNTTAPLFGIWSPVKKNAPFVCIEPWYGRCDAVGFDGGLFEREYANSLMPGDVFNAEYSIEFN